MALAELTMVSQLDPSKMLEHIGHELEMTTYRDYDGGTTDGTIINVALECMDCSVVLADADAMTEEA